MSPPETRSRNGFAAPLAVCLLIAVALLALLMLEGALAELRTSAAAAAEARVSAAAETAMAEALSLHLDSTVLALPAGNIAWQRITDDEDSVAAHVQVFGNSLARVIVTVRSGDARIRVFVGVSAHARLVRSGLVPGEVALVPLEANWWVPSR